MANGKTKIEERISEAGEQSEEQNEQVFEWLEKNMKVDYIDWKSIPDGWYVVGGSGDQEKFVPFSVVIEGKISIPAPNEFFAIDSEVFKKFYKEWLIDEQRKKIEEYESLLVDKEKEFEKDPNAKIGKMSLEQYIPMQKKFITKIKIAAGIAEEKPKAEKIN